MPNRPLRRLALPILIAIALGVAGCGKDAPVAETPTTGSATQAGAPASAQNGGTDTSASPQHPITATPPAETDLPPAATMSPKDALAALYALGAKITQEGTDPDSPVIGVDISFKTIEDDQLEPLESLGSLKKLNMWEDRRVTNAGIRRLGGLTQLEDLDIRSTKINDTGMRYLEKLTNLKKLSLGQTKITDYGVEHIKGLTKLQSLNLGYTGLTDDGMPFLKDMTELENLYLARTAVSDAGMPVIKGFTKLKMLYMPGVYVTDVGLENLKDLTELQQLVISDSKVTDAGLVYLKGLSKLSTVDLTGTRVTEAGLKELGVALPHCHVNHRPPASSP